MPTRDATLLPPLPEDPGSGKSLDSVGALKVLGAMVDQKRRVSVDETKPRRPPQRSDVFLKVR